MSFNFFARGRFRAIVLKEFIQMRRDRLTFGMMIGIPLLQLTLFGFAINTDPKNLPAALVLGDRGPFQRSIATALKNSTYFRFTTELPNEEAAREAMRLAANKLPMKTRFMVREEFGGDES